MTNTNPIFCRANVALLLVTLACFALAACSSPAEFAAGAVAVGAGAAALLDTVAPLMSVEQFAQMREGVGEIDSTVQATKSVLAAVVDAFEAFRDRVAEQDAGRLQLIQEQAAQVAKQAAALAERPERAEMALWSAGAGSGGTLASRLLSMRKHGIVSAAKAS
jgi:hypothetical protein